MEIILHFKNKFVQSQSINYIFDHVKYNPKIQGKALTLIPVKGEGMFVITIKSLKMFAHTFLLMDDEHSELKMKSLGEKNRTKGEIICNLMANVSCY